ncbi:hypothetical protein SAMN05421677_11771 [Halobacillus aidingensis]|uniref:Uncharacterized protein n=2 Tax=Halobacillus aidingensis TaxID=240303 RepID=A0A1H0S9N5_HALAD|nr:hypothetical protein SAMN05421677_11771 [Halobacillus aidingensis]
MLYLHEEKKACYDSYIVDVEYNRNFGKKVKTIIDDEEQVMKITCDIILHSRGSNLEQDNLIAIEMKKSNRPQKEKNKDRYRLMLLTRDSFTGNAFSFDGTKLPDHVCRYKLGIFYEIDLKSRTVNVEYYKKGELLKKYTQEY